MPRANFNPDEAYHASTGFKEGWGTVVDYKALVYQFPPTKNVRPGSNRKVGDQDPPALYGALSIQPCDPDGKPTEDTQEVLLSIAKPNKETGTLDIVRPGNFPDGDLNGEPEDCGGDPGAEGNTLYCEKDGWSPSDKCKWVLFTKSLKEKGFKPDVINRGYFPDLVGLVAHFKTEDVPKQSSSDFDSTKFIVTEIKRYPYEKAAAKPAKAAPKAAAAANGKANGVAKPERVESTSDDSAEDIALNLLTDVVAKKYKGKRLKDLKALKVAAHMAASSITPESLQKEVRAQFADPAWLTDIGVSADLFVVEADGQVAFA